MSEAADQKTQMHKLACEQLTWQDGIGLACTLPQCSQTQA